MSNVKEFMDAMSKAGISGEDALGAWRLAREAEEKRLAREAEMEEKRLGREAEETRLAREAEETRLAREAEETRLAREAEEKRLAREAEETRLAREAEEKKLAREAEETRLAREAVLDIVKAPNMTPQERSQALLALRTDPGTQALLALRTSAVPFLNCLLLMLFLVWLSCVQVGRLWCTTLRSSSLSVPLRRALWKPRRVL
jgi:hypothetical protein